MYSDCFKVNGGVGKITISPSLQFCGSVFGIYMYMYILGPMYTGIITSKAK